MSKQLAMFIFLVLISGCLTTDKVVKAQQCNDIKSCSESIRLRVGEESKWICSQNSIDKLVIVKANLSKTGEIITSTLVIASKDDEFNTAAIEAVKAAAPFVELTMLNQAEYEEASEINFVFQGTLEAE